LKKLLLFLLLALVACALVLGFLRKSAPPEVRFTQVKRQTVVSTVPTNGKVEPYEWQPVHTETAGLATRVDVQNGKRVGQGAVLAEVSDPEIRADIDSSSARVSEAQANLQQLRAGGRLAEQSDIESSLSRARFNLQTAQRDYEATQRLVAKQAATAMEERAAADKVRQTQLEIDGLEKRRAALVSKPDIEAAEARLADAEAALKLAKERSANTLVRAPIAGEVYDLAIRRGVYLNAGDLVANVGTLDRLRVRVYVDEPLLGRVKLGQPVTIRWEALPGKMWNGVVDRMPTSIQTLGSRQVGEVVCVIENPGRDLIPGNNVDAEIRTAVADGALMIPKETLRHDAQGDYVFLLRGAAGRSQTVERRDVKTGIANVTQAQITEGLSEGDSIALPTDVPLKPGERVQPIS
jgi:HlyD family secretion protein